MTSLLRRGFRLMNRFFMVPAFRLGFGPILVSPFAGYIMVIKHRGRRTGKVRYTPVNYCVENGSVYCIAGFGKGSHWIRNLEKDSNVELLMPAGAIACKAEVVSDPQERLRATRQVMVNSGFAAVLFEGIVASRITDEKLAEISKDYVTVRFRPYGIGSGPADKGGWFWVWPTLAIIFLLYLLFK